MTESTAAARGALAEVADLAPEQVAVLGDGELAEFLHRELATSVPLDADPPPFAVIDTAGTDDAIDRAIRTVASGGRVVLAVEPQSSFVDVRTYADIHARGLTIVGVRRTSDAR
jgi:threonine dehydrogenase-like Zn-dependent dehydrogenase